MHKSKTSIGLVEFVALMAMMTSLTAMSIDSMLPALSEIGLDLGLQRPNDSQLVISLLLVGMAVGQMFLGPLSDSIGRKPTVYIGFGLFIIGCLMSMLTTNFQIMLAGRMLQGLGAAAPRVVVVALIRDLYTGREMARVMSFVMAVFILIPVVAPAFGQAILMVAHWRWIFGSFLIIVLFIGIWFAWRQPETLSPDSRTTFSMATIGRAIREAVTHRMVFGYTITIGLVFGAFIGYLNSAQQVFQEQYDLGTLFPLYFALLALSLGCAFIANSRLVMRFGLHEISYLALKSIVALSIVFFGVATITDGHPPLWSLTIYFILTFFGLGILFGNLNALAMKPLGHIAGVGAAVVGSLSTFISLLLGTFIGQCYNATVLPLIGGFAIFSITAILVMRWVESKEPLPQASQ